MERQRWTDERLDKAFGRVDLDLSELRIEMRKGFDQVDKRFDQVDKRFDLIEKRFARVELWFASLSCTIIGSLVAGVIAALSLR